MLVHTTSKHFLFFQTILTACRRRIPSATLTVNYSPLWLGNRATNRFAALCMVCEPNRYGKSHGSSSTAGATGH